MLGFFTTQYLVERLCTFLHIQFFLSLIALPILICWGLPLSVMTIVGNLLFAPLLSLFLLFASGIFMCQLAGIPYSFLSYCLELTTTCWTRLLECAHSSWLYGFAQPPVLCVVLIPVLAYGCVVYTARARSWYKATAMGGLLLCVTLLLNLYAYLQPNYHDMHCNKGNVAYHIINNQLILIDPGFIGQRVSAPSWIQYTLAPEIIKHTGRTVIDACIILQPTHSLMQALEKLCQKMYIKKLYLPKNIDAEKQPYTRYDIAPHVETIALLDQNSIQLIHDEHSRLTLVPLRKTIKNGSGTWQAFCIEGTIDNEELTIYPARYTKRNKDISKITQ